MRPVVSICKTLKGMRNRFLQVEMKPYKDETSATFRDAHSEWSEIYAPSGASNTFRAG